MSDKTVRTSIVTPERIERAVQLAGRQAEEYLHQSAFDCAVFAVSEVFDPLLARMADLSSPQIQALRLRIIDEVERRLGVHRRRMDIPCGIPASAVLPDPSAQQFAAAA